MTQTTLTNVAGCMAVINFVCFALGVKLVFTRKGRPGPGYTWIKIGAVTTGIVEAYAIFRSEDVPLAATLAGLVLLLVSFVLFWACVYWNRKKPLSLAYSHDLPAHMNSRGPYRWVRHPFYTSYLTAYVGGLIASLNPVVLLFVLAMAFIYWDAARREEAKFARSDFADAYAAYRRKTGMFLPFLSSKFFLK
jgi:protein-S-isoprenylcysteine O-methyltransferase Ste14